MLRAAGICAMKAPTSGDAAAATATATAAPNPCEGQLSVFLSEMRIDVFQLNLQLYNLELLLLQAPGSNPSTNLTTNSRILSQLLSQKLVPTKEPNPIKRCFKGIEYFIEDNWKRIWVVLLWLAICAGLFTWKFIQYKDRAVFDVMGYCVTAAKGAAETLKFNMAIILLPVCRNTIT